MANALGREIKSGELVVLSASIFKDPEASITDRTFVCESGKGMKPYLMSDTIHGRFADGTNGTVGALWIDEQETKALHVKIAQEQHEVDARNAGEL